jgi:hypothetical protein
MARYRKIDPRIWNDAKVLRLSPFAKLAFIYILTHPNMTSLGAMRGTPEGLSAELSQGDKGLAEAFAEGFTEAIAEGLLEVNAKACYIAAPNFLRYNQPESPNVVKAWNGALDLIPECDAKVLLVERVTEYLKPLPEAWRKPWVKPSTKASGKAMRNPKPKPKQDLRNKELRAERSEKDECGDTSDSDSSDKPIARPVAKLRFFEAVEPALGSCGPGSGRHPVGSPQYTADHTVIMQWWDEVIWPDGRDPPECIERFEQVVKLAHQAKPKRKPMAWLTARIKTMQSADN